MLTDILDHIAQTRKHLRLLRRVLDFWKDEPVSDAQRANVLMHEGAIEVWEAHLEDLRALYRNLKDLPQEQQQRAAQ